MKAVLHTEAPRAGLRLQGKTLVVKGIGTRKWWRECWRTGESLQGRHTSALAVTLIPKLYYKLSLFLYWSRQLLPEHAYRPYLEAMHSYITTFKVWSSLLSIQVKVDPATARDALIKNSKKPNGKSTRQSPAITRGQIKLRQPASKKIAEYQSLKPQA